MVLKLLQRYPRYWRGGKSPASSVAEITVARQVVGTPQESASIVRSLGLELSLLPYHSPSLSAYLHSLHTYVGICSWRPYWGISHH